MIHVKYLSKSFGDIKAVDHISLTIPDGQICGYLGPNGAGKTTTIRMLTGMIPPDEGTAEVAGYDIVQSPMEAKRWIGVVPESGAVYQNLTPFEYLQFIGRMYNMVDKRISSRINQFSELFGLSDRIHERMTSFSKGMKQKVVIIASLLHNPHVMFFDEPLSGLDANSALLLKSLIRNLADEGKTIFYCSHVLEVVENICDRVVILDQGKIVADGSVADLKSMTERNSLEGLFSQLTQDQDMAQLAKEFSKRVVEKEDEM